MDAITTPARSEAQEIPSILKIIWEALKGSHRDYTEGPIGPAILVLAIPMVLEMAMEGIFAVADIFYVSRLGAYAVATVGLTESLLMIVYSMGMGLSIGLGAIVARRIGEKDRDGAARAAVQGLFLGAAISVTIGTLGAIFAPELLGLMGATPEVIERGVGYTRVMLGGNAAIILLFLGNAVFRGAGDGAIAMRSLWLANGINLVLAPIFIFGFGPIPAMGVQGAAIATTISRAIGAAFTLGHLFGGRGRIEVSSRHWGLDFKLMRSILRLSSSAMFQALVGMASWIGLARVVAGFGSEATAGYTIGIRVVLFALLPAYGLGGAAATMVGQALGAGKPERAEAAVWRAGFYNLCFLGSIGLLFLVFPREIVSFFTQEAQVAGYGVDCLRIVASGFFFYAYGMTITQSFNGAGDTWTPTWLNLIFFWILEIPLAYWLAVGLGWGPVGVFLSITLAFSLSAVAAAILFRRGKWKLRQV